MDNTHTLTYSAHTHWAPTFNTSTFTHNLNTHDASRLWDTSHFFAFIAQQLTVRPCGKLKWVRKDSPLSILILCHLSARSELGGKEIRKNEHVILVRAHTTGTVHSLFLSLPLCLSLSLSLIMEKLAQKSDPFRTELNKKLMCTMAFQGDLLKTGHTEFTPPKFESLENTPVTTQAN